MKKALISLFIIFLISIPIFLYSKLSGTRTRLVDTVKLERRDIINYIRANGRIESVKEGIIYSRDNIIIDKILVKEGDKVAKGKELIKLDLTEKTDAVERGRLKVEQAKISVNTAKNKLEASELTYSDPEELETNKIAKFTNYQNILIEKAAAERELETAKGLYRIGAESLQDLNTKEDRLKKIEVNLLLAKKEMDEANGLFEKKEKTNINLLTLKTEYENAVRQKGIAEAELNLAVSQLERLKVISPIDGTVIKIFVKELEFVMPGEKIITIADVERLQVRAEVDELDAAKIKNGQEAMITFDAFPEKEFKGHIEDISPKASMEENRTIVETIILIDQDTDILKIENQVDVKIIIEEKKGVPSLPLTVIYPGDQHYVFVFQDGAAKRVNITTGISSPDLIEIVNGLKEGDKIIMSREIDIKDGENVRIK